MNRCQEYFYQPVIRNLVARSYDAPVELVADYAVKVQCVGKDEHEGPHLYDPPSGWVADVARFSMPGWNITAEAQAQVDDWLAAGRPGPKQR